MSPDSQQRARELLDCLAARTRTGTIGGVLADLELLLREILRDPETYEAGFDEILQLVEQVLHDSKAG